MTIQLFLNSLLFTTQMKMLKMKQTCTLFCSFTLFILDPWMFNVINSSKMNNSKLFKNFQGRRKVFKDNKMVFKNQGHNEFW